MAALDDAIEAFAQRMGWTPEKGRVEARRRIDNAVDEALAGSQTSFDTLPIELEPFARTIFRERLRRGQGAEDVERVVASTGGRLP